MGANRLNTLVRVLSASGTRRHMTGLGLASLVAMVNDGGAVAKKKRRCKRRLSLRAKWCLKLSKDRCRAVPKPDGTACEGDGQCLAGACNLRPTCQGVVDSVCITGDECCSEICTGGACQPGIAGKPCLADGDCLSGECFAFACV